MAGSFSIYPLFHRIKFRLDAVKTAMSATGRRPQHTGLRTEGAGRTGRGRA